MNAHTFHFPMFYLPKDRWTGLATSLALHAVLLTVGGVMLVKPAQYGIQKGVSGIEIQLVAAPASITMAPTIKEEIPVVPIIEKKEDIIPAPQPKPVVKEAVQQPPVNAQPTVQKGGSSRVAGKNEATIQSAGGAIAEVQPDYLSNPAPAYPYEARKKGWQGVVILKTLIDKEGKPIKIEVEKTSGHKLLDDTALSAVKKWRFHPATVGSLNVESLARVPVKFDLSEENK